MEQLDHSDSDSVTKVLCDIVGVLAMVNSSSLCHIHKMI